LRIHIHRKGREGRNGHVGGTPTPLLVDNKGIVQKAWLGKLPELKEKEVLNQSCQGEAE